MRPLLAALSLLALLFSGAIARADESVTLAVGAATTIALEENPSTGFRWEIDGKDSSNLTILRIDDLGYTQGGKLIGAPGTHRWRVTAKTPGHARLVLVYRRSWEHVAPARRSTTEITVTGR